MSNSFNGRMREFPHIQVDNFGSVEGFPAPSACFLSHIHADHLLGLDEKYTGPFIYCSHATKDMLLCLKSRKDPEKSKFNRLNPKFLRPLALDFAHMLSFKSFTLQVTLIDANHSPGSVMFLFQDSSGIAVLYTGDLRAEPWFVNSLNQHPSLIPFMTGSTLSCIYADTTFAYREKPYIKMPSIADGIQKLLAYLELYDESTNLFFTTLTSGYEKAFLWTAAKFGEKIHIDDAGYQQIELASKHDATCRSLLTFLTTDPDATRIHACSKKSQCPHRTRRDAVFLSPVVNKSNYELEAWNAALNISDYEAMKAMNFEPADENARQQASIFIYQERRYVRGKGAQALLPGRLLFHFSRHSSYDELARFVQLFQPKSVYPCVTTPENEADPEFLMRTLFGHLCSLKQRFFYDEMILERYPERCRHRPSRHEMMGINKKKARQFMLKDSSSKSTEDSVSQSNSQILHFLNNESMNQMEKVVDCQKSQSSYIGSPSSAQPVSTLKSKKFESESLHEPDDEKTAQNTSYSTVTSRKRPHLVRGTTLPHKISKNLKHMSSTLSGARIHDLARMISHDDDIWYNLQLDFRARTRIM